MSEFFSIHDQNDPIQNRQRIELAFVLDAIQDWPQWAAQFGPEVQVVVLQAQGDAVAQMAEVLAAQAPGTVDAIHLFSHGQDGVVQLGQTALSLETLAGHAHALSTLGTALAADAQWLIYGCDVAQSPQGQALIDQLADLTGARVAASTDLTGASDLGGNWVLEYIAGAGDTVSVLQLPEVRNVLTNDSPVLDLNGGDAGTGFTVTLANAATGLVAATAVASDTENNAAHWGGGSLSVQRIKTGGAADGSAHDVYSFTSGGQFSATGTITQGANSNGTLLTSPGGIQFGTWTYTSATGKLDVAFDANATGSLVQDVVRHIGYSNATPYGDATLRVSLNDGNTPTTADVTVTSSTIHVTQTALDADGDAADGFNLKEALAIAKNGDTILIHDGTYRGQFVTTKAVTIDALNGSNGNVTLEAPDAADLVNSTQNSLRDKVRIPILDIRHDDPVSGTTVVKNISIDGRYQARLISGRVNGNGDEDLIGIAVYNSSAEIDRVSIAHIATALENNGDYSGYSENYGILAEGGSALAATVNLTVKNSTIGTFQKTGIIAWGPKLNIDIHDNTITLVGALGKSNQNGMQIGSSGARTGTTGSVTNNQINNIGTTSTEYSATGILLRQIGAGFTVSGNTLSSNGALGASPTLGSTGIGMFEVGQAVTITNNTFSQITGGVVAEAPLGPLNTYDAAHVIQGNNFSSTHTAIYDSQDSSPWNSAVNKLAANPLSVSVHSPAVINNGRGFIDYVLFGGADSFTDTGAGASRVDAGSGNDTVTAGGGSDTLIGGPGDDVLNGGAGGDTLMGDATVTLAADAGVAVTNWGNASQATLNTIGLTAVAFTSSDSLAIGSNLVFTDPSYIDTVVDGSGGAVALGVAGKIVQYTGTWSGGVFTSTAKADANALLVVWDADGTGAGTTFRAVVLTGVSNTVAVGSSGNDTLSGGGANDVFLFAASDNGTDTITDFGAGDAIQVKGRNFGSGSVSTGDGTAVAANSLQLSVNGGVTTLHVDTDGTADTAELVVQLTGTYQTGNFELVGEYIRYKDLTVTPPPPVTPPTQTTTVDGTTVTSQSTSGSDGSTTTTVTVAPVTSTRPEDPSTPNSALADIPLATSGGDTLIQISLPVGIGVSAQGVSGASLTLRQKLINASQPRIELPTDFNQILDTGIDAYVPTVGDQAQVTVRTLTLTTGSSGGTGSTAPAQPIVISGATGTGEADPAHPQRQEALVIDARTLPAGTVLDLRNVEFAIVIGPSRLVGGSGANVVVGDGSQQFIVLGPEDDVLRGGAGDDTVGSKSGNDKLYGDEGNDWVVGGAGNDQLEGGSGNDILQGGQSDAGTWTFTLSSQGQIVSSYQAKEAELAEAGTYSRVGSWAGADGSRTSDDRLAFSYERTDTVKAVATLFNAVLGRLPTVGELNQFATAGHSSSQLAELAYTHYLATHAQPVGQPLSAQVQALITQVWGAANVSQDIINTGVTYITQGGSWAQGLLWLSQQSQATGRISDASGNLALAQSLVVNESGWSSDTGADTLSGGEGNDLLVGGRGNDWLDGGAGLDMAVYSGRITDYSFHQQMVSGQLQTIVTNRYTGEVDTLIGIEYGQVGSKYYGLGMNANGLPPLGQEVAMADYVMEFSPAQVALLGIAGV